MGETNDCPSNHTQITTENEFTSEDAPQIIANERINKQQQGNNVYFVGKVKKYGHQDNKLEFLIKCLGYSNLQNTWQLEDHLSAVLV